MNSSIQARSVRQLPLAVRHMRQNFAFDAMAAIQRAILDRAGLIVKRGVRHFPRIGSVRVTGPFVIMEIDPSSVTESERKQVISPAALAEYSNAVRKPVWGLSDMPKWSRSPSPGAWLVTSIGAVRQINPGEFTMSDSMVAQLSPAVQTQAFDIDIDFDLSRIPRDQYAFLLGKDDSGKDIVDTLPSIKSLMVIGESGSGKSNLFASIVYTITKRTSAAMLRVYLASAKASQFSPFFDLPHITKGEWGSVASDATQLDAVVTVLYAEFERRDALFSQVKVDNLDSYMKKTGKMLPRLLFVADELLTISLGISVGERNEVMDHLAKLLNIGRSHGISIFIGITKPNYKTVSTNITSNIDNRIAFRVADKNVSNDFDCPGAHLIQKESPGSAVTRLYGKYGKLQTYLVRTDSPIEPGATQFDVDPVPVMKLSRQLSEREAELVIYAVERLDGKFSINKLWAAFKDGGWSANAIGKLGVELESLGWLTSQAEAGKGRSGSRMVKSELEAMARSGVRTNVIASILSV